MRDRAVCELYDGKRTIRRIGMHLPVSVGDPFVTNDTVYEVIAVSWNVDYESQPSQEIRQNIVVKKVRDAAELGRARA